MSKQIKISDGLVISRAWLEKRIFETGKYLSFCDDDRTHGYNISMKEVLGNCTPLMPVVEKAFRAGEENTMNHITCRDAVFGSRGAAIDKQEFLNGKIEINE